MKKKKRNFITKIFSLLLLGIISITLLGSWTYDLTNDTITSDNLFMGNTTTTTQYIGHYYQQPGNAGYSITPNPNSNCFIVEVEPSTTYTISTTENVQLYMLGVRAYLDINKNVIGGNETGYSQTINSFTTYNDTYYIRFSVDVNATYNVMLNKGNTAISWEPYGTYVNKKEYDSVVEDWESVTEDYNTMVEEYDELNALYQQLQQDYNTLESNYNTLENNYNDAIDNLDTLRDEYQELQQQYNDLENLIKPFVFDYSQMQINLGNATQTGENFVSSTSVSNISSYFDEFGGFNLDTLYNNYSGFGSSYNSIEFLVPNLNLVYFNANFVFTGIPDMNYRIYLTNSRGQSSSFSYDVKDIVFENEQSNLNFSLLGGIIHSNSDSINEFVLPLQYTNYSRLILTGLNVGALNVHKINFGYNKSYNVGFQDGYNSITNLYDNSIEYYRNIISEKDATIKLLNAQIVDLNEQVLNSVGWRPLFFAIADTPLKTISNVLGFELFGVNLFKAFIGIITALALIWLIKKLLSR